MTLQKSHLGAFHMAPWFSSGSTMVVGEPRVHRGVTRPQRSTSDVGRAGLTQAHRGLSRKSPRCRALCGEGDVCVGVKQLGRGAGVGLGAQGVRGRVGTLEEELMVRNTS